MQNLNKLLSASATLTSDQLVNAHEKISSDEMDFSQDLILPLKDSLDLYQKMIIHEPESKAAMENLAEALEFIVDFNPDRPENAFAEIKEGTCASIFKPLFICLDKLISFKESFETKKAALKYSQLVQANIQAIKNFFTRLYETLNDRYQAPIKRIFHEFLDHVSELKDANAVRKLLNLG